jgi:hypothetical protein
MQLKCRIKHFMMTAKFFREHFENGTLGGALTSPSHWFQYADMFINQPHG